MKEISIFRVRRGLKKMWPHHSMPQMQGLRLGQERWPNVSHPPEKRCVLGPSLNTLIPFSRSQAACCPRHRKPGSLCFRRDVLSTSSNLLPFNFMRQNKQGHPPGPSLLHVPLPASPHPASLSHEARVGHTRSAGAIPPLASALRLLPEASHQLDGPSLASPPSLTSSLR